MSLRRHILRVVGLLTAVAMVFGALAGSAIAKKTASKSKVRAQLLRAVKKNPRILHNKSFLRKAGLVHFKLPVTVRLRGSNNTTPVSPVYDDVNPNSASVDLGASLGKRTVNLGGSLPAEVEFNDQFDGGALGNVRISLSPSTTGGLTTTSIPLLWNNNVGTNGATHAWWGIGFDGLGATNPNTGITGLVGSGVNTIGEYDDGCGAFIGNADLPTPLTTFLTGSPLGEPYFNSGPSGPGPSALDPTNSLGNALQFRANPMSPVINGAISSYG